MQWLIDIIVGIVLNHFTGIIVMWAGTELDVPDGWAWCDGNNGTPDLRNQFVKGIKTWDQVGFTAGTVAHDHTFTGNGHNHGLGPGADVAIGAGFGTATGFNPAVGTTDFEGNQPPFYKLAYIMKL